MKGFDLFLIISLMKGLTVNANPNPASELKKINEMYFNGLYLLSSKADIN